MTSWNICGVDITPGEKKQVILEPNVPGYEMPATIICGSEPGKTIIITAGIHRGEYPGVAAVIRIAAAIDPAKVRGRILLVHYVNTSELWEASADKADWNLNANFPGNPDGDIGDKIADYFVRKVYPQADFIIDLHSGGQMEPLTACLFFPEYAGVREVSMAAACATDIPYLIASTADRGLYSYGASKGIPALLLERGHSGACSEEWICEYERDICLLLDHFGMYAFDNKGHVCKKTIYNKSIYLTAEEKGLWYPAVKEGMKVERGQVLGCIKDYFGNLISEYCAKEDGTVFYYTSALAVKPRSPLVAYGLDKYKTSIAMGQEPFF